MKSQSGFSLVEVLATGAISVVLAGSILSILKMNNNQLQESMARFRMGQICTVVSDQIRRTARAAATVKMDADPAIGVPPALAVKTRVDQITFCRTTACVEPGDVLGKYRFTGAPPNRVIQEWVLPGPAWRNITFNGNPVTVGTMADEFAVAPGRQGIDIFLSLQMIVLGNIVSVPPITESVVCRNWPSP